MHMYSHWCAAHSHELAHHVCFIHLSSWWHMTISFCMYANGQWCAHQSQCRWNQRTVSDLSHQYIFARVHEVYMYMKWKFIQYLYREYRNAPKRLCSSNSTCLRIWWIYAPVSRNAYARGYGVYTYVYVCKEWSAPFYAPLDWSTGVGEIEDAQFQSKCPARTHIATHV